MSFSIDIPALPRLIDLLDRFPDIVKEELAPPAHAALLSLIPDLATYPPQRPGTRYHRTGTYGRTWTAAQPEWSAVGSGFEAKIGNPTPYGPYLADADMQARWNVGKWKTTEDVLRAHEVEIQRYFDGALDRIIARVGG
jgi:hypothetical protein